MSCSGIMGAASRYAESLTALLDRVKQDEQHYPCATKQHLLDVARYINTHQISIDYTKEEYQKAVEVLTWYHLAKLASISFSGKGYVRSRIEKEQARNYMARCARCGLPLSARESVEAGLGQVCRRKIGVN